jgi:hypothetical protein
MTPEDAARRVHIEVPADRDQAEYLARIVQKEIDENGEVYVDKHWGTFREMWRTGIAPDAVFKES